MSAAFSRSTGSESATRENPWEWKGTRLPLYPGLDAGTIAKTGKADRSMIMVTAKERRRLLKFGKPLGAAIKELMTIVTSRTFARWASGEKKMGPRGPKRGGRPRTEEEIRQLVVKLAQETGWGYTRIQGELAKLGVRKISRGTISAILKEHGLDRGPERGESTWDQFLKRHAKTLWACDFFTKKVWTPRGLVEVYLLVFIQIGSRRVWVSQATAHPHAQRVEQQPRNMCMQFQERDETPTYLIHDRYTKFTGRRSRT